MTLTGHVPELLGVLSILLVRRAGNISQPLWLSILLAGVNPRGHCRRADSQPASPRAGRAARNKTECLSRPVSPRFGVYPMTSQGRSTLPVIIVMAVALASFALIAGQGSRASAQAQVAKDREAKAKADAAAVQAKAAQAAKGAQAKEAEAQGAQALGALGARGDGARR